MAGHQTVNLARKSNPCFTTRRLFYAYVAQLAVPLFCTQEVGGSMPLVGSHAGVASLGSALAW